MMGMPPYSREGQRMPFYFRIPLPGPFGYSKRIGGKRRRPAGQPVPRLTREQSEHADRMARTFFAVPRDVVHGEDGSLTFLAGFDGRPPVQITVRAAESPDVWEAVEGHGTIAVTFRPGLRTVESVEGINPTW
jgi:hypothetical protein